jgi:hypothetical protein
MIILSKKRIINLLTILTVCLTICLVQTANVNDETVETVTLPVTNKVIVIDARTSECQMRGQKVVMELVKQKQI